MTLRAHDVASEVRRRLPDVGVKKLHKLLYYCQGHHLAAFDRALFVESISAWDMGPVVGRLWKTEKVGEPFDPPARLDEAQLNTVGYVLSRYGRLTARDLEHMTHAEDPWRRADERRELGGSEWIRPEWISEYFRAEDLDDEPEPIPAELVRAFLSGAGERRREPLTADTVDGIRARAS